MSCYKPDRSPEPHPAKTASLGHGSQVAVSKKKRLVAFQCNLVEPYPAQRLGVEGLAFVRHILSENLAVTREARTSGSAGGEPLGG